MTVEQNISLKKYNTFQIDAHAQYFARFQSTEELINLLTTGAIPDYNGPSRASLILGGGSNILLTRNIEGLAIKNEIGGMQVIEEDDEYVYVQAGAGVNWHSFVLFCVEKGYGGVENLSLIPGSVGASPMQNIGAYGVEIKDVFHELKAFHLEEKANYTFREKDCAFGYRDSVFKNKYKGQFIITQVTFRLRKNPVFNISYGALQQELDSKGVTDLSVKAISDAVIRIRQSKLPDPLVIGNAGSFFKNPEIPVLQFEKLQRDFPSIIGYPAREDKVKVAAGWMIEQCGWKGYRDGDAGCHEKQALVLVNYGNASGAQILELSEKIQASVLGKYGITLEKEVNII